MSVRPVKIAAKNLSAFDKSIFDSNIEITGVSINASDIKKGDLFIALAGSKTHGANFIDQAITNGAVAVLSDDRLNTTIPSFIHPSPRKIAGALAAWVNNFPFDQITAVGITGTNGKTTTSNLLKQIWEYAQLKTGLIGTLGVEFNGQTLDSTRTTPEADELQAMTAFMVEQGLSHLVMEVSSHGLDQARVKGCKYKAVGFSNLTQDHLDYHKNMENYFNVKAELFSKEYAEMAIINIDDPYGLRLIKQIQIPFYSASQKDKTADWCYEKITEIEGGFDIEIRGPNGVKVFGNFPMLGDFNLDNLLLAVALASVSGLDAKIISDSLGKLNNVPGRLEQVKVGQLFTALVDYAHTPDAVDRVLVIARKLTKGKVIAVLGCGGDRDSSKRALMGQTLFSGSDLAIFTSDNPRNESPDEILKQMVSTLDLGKKGIVIKDRRQSIDFAVSQAAPGDYLLILGKGHESGQEVSGVITAFDDRIELIASIKQGLDK